MDIDTALDFITRYPVGAVLTTGDFDSWLDSLGLLEIPEAKVGSQAWRGHVCIRNQLRAELNTLVRGSDLNGAAFQVEVLKYNETYIVRDAMDSVKNGIPALIAKTGKFVKTKSRKIEKMRAQVGTDGASLIDQIRIDQMGEVLLDFQGRISREAEIVKKQLARLEASIAKRLGPPKDEEAT